MLTRDMLSDAQWNAIRTTPHLVMLAVSAAGGTPFEEWRERKAGLRGISDAINSSNPLLRAIADSAQIVEAEEDIRAWYYTLPDAERTHTSLQAKALGSAQLALDAVRSQGSAEDLVQYRDFILGTATRVARVAREGDFLGIDGERISRGERDFIARLEDVEKGRTRLNAVPCVLFASFRPSGGCQAFRTRRVRRAEARQPRAVGQVSTGYS